MKFDDSHFYEVVALEIRNRQLNDGLWTKAFSEADGNKERTQAKYIGYRVAQLKALDDQARRQSAESAAASVRAQRAVAEEGSSISFSPATQFLFYFLAVPSLLVAFSGFSVGESGQGFGGLSVAALTCWVAWHYRRHE